ncbi:GLUG motif-containing protein [Burkholderia cenocepacia]|uniref:two-partner secretion domain-containing protein n=1 Tax=Burkholderia cenocepacia TaxID=95486 RepID=UPI002AB77EAF|nr:GLUG motif-containing protein [Burkholderia cenocepacia]
MNKTYALVWNPNQGCWNAVGETARRRGKSSGGKCLAAVAAVSLLGFAALPAHALPTGEAIASGKADIARGADGKSLSINQHTDKLVTQWQDFSVANGERVSFQQPNSRSIALNRVIGTNGSQIHGSIDANGRVFLVNPNGVLFGSDAQVNVGGLVASTKNLTDADFLANNFRFTGDSAQSIVNDGRITAANGGSVALLGARVANNGTIQAKLGSVALGAGDAFRVSFDGGGLLNLQVTRGAVDAQASNGGLIKADGGNVLMTARAADNLLNAVVNQTGTLEARGLAKRGGKITLDGGTVNVGGKLDASAAATGAPTSWVTTRGERVNVAADTTVDTRAGDKTGVWTIGAANAGVDSAGARDAGRSIDGDTLSRNLGTTHVALTNLTGDLVVAGPVSWDSDTLLKLTAHQGNVDLQQSLSATGANARVSVNAADQVRVNDALKLTGENAALEFNAKNGHAVDLDKAVVTLSGQNATFRANGTNYKVLHTVDDLRNVDRDLNGRYVLGNAIDGKDATFRSIGGYGVFTGVFDGLGNTIGKLTVSNPGVSDTGLFALNFGRIANLRLNDVTMRSSVSSYSVGTLVGTNFGTVSNVTAAGIDVSGGKYVGGLVGTNYGVIDNARAAGRVSGDRNTSLLGGLVAENATLDDDFFAPARISNSHADVRVTASGNHATGGLAGLNRSLIETSSSAGSVKSTSSGAVVGGLVGRNDKDAAIRDSASAASVIAGDNAIAGGLVADNNGTLANSTARGALSAGNGATVGGAIGRNSGNVSAVTAQGNVLAGANAVAGGLVGTNHATLNDARASGDVVAGAESIAGGLAGANRSTLQNAQASGKVTTTVLGWAGGLVGDNTGTIADSTASGDVTGGMNSRIGGLAGVNASSGAIRRAGARGSVRGADSAVAGGLVGTNNGLVTASLAEGSVTAGTSAHAGGLVGLNHRDVQDSRATGNVVAEHGTATGGLVGTNFGTIKQSVASGDVAAQRSGTTGGLVGTNRGSIDASSASGAVASAAAGRTGGLVGQNQGAIRNASATGNVSAGSNSDVGGLVGLVAAGASVDDSSASGDVYGDYMSQVGGLAGNNGGTIRASSSSGTVSGHIYTKLGGLTGGNFGFVRNSSTTSRIDFNRDYAQTYGSIAGVSHGWLDGNTSSGNGADVPLVGLNLRPPY